jgi:hypothetical protein
MSYTHGGPLEAEQAKHAATGGCHSISKHRRELEIFGEGVEYITAANATCQALWLVRVLAEVKGSTSSTPLLRVDNKFTIALIKNPVLHEQSKHIEVKYHLVRESVENGRINVKFIRSEE